MSTWPKQTTGLAVEAGELIPVPEGTQLVAGTVQMVNGAQLILVGPLTMAVMRRVLLETELARMTVYPALEEIRKAQPRCLPRSQKASPLAPNKLASPQQRNQLRSRQAGIQQRLTRRRANRK